MLKINTFHEEVERADYGGEDGHEAEEMDDEDENPTLEANLFNSVVFGMIKAVPEELQER